MLFYLGKESKTGYITDDTVGLRQTSTLPIRLNKKRPTTREVSTHLTYIWMFLTLFVCIFMHYMQQKIDFSEENVSGAFPVAMLVEWYGWMLVGCYAGLTLG